MLEELTLELANDPTQLESLSAKHPEHAEALAEFARDLALDGDPNVEADVDEEQVARLVGPAMARYQMQIKHQAEVKKLLGVIGRMLDAATIHGMPQDHACAACYPNGESIGDGEWRCPSHEAKALLGR